MAEVASSRSYRQLCEKKREQPLLSSDQQNLLESLPWQAGKREGREWVLTNRVPERVLSVFQEARTRYVEFGLYVYRLEGDQKQFLARYRRSTNKSTKGGFEIIVHASELVHLQYVDAVLFRNSSHTYYKPITRECVGWIVSENSDRVYILFDRSIEYHPHERVDLGESGIVVPRCNIQNIVRLQHENSAHIDSKRKREQVSNASQNKNYLCRVCVSRKGSEKLGHSGRR